MLRPYISWQFVSTGLGNQVITGDNGNIVEFSSNIYYITDQVDSCTVPRSPYELSSLR